MMGVMAKDKIADADLRDVAALTAKISVARREVEALDERRTAAARRHTASGATYEDLMRATGLSRHGVYKMLRRGDGPLRKQEPAVG